MEKRIEKEENEAEVLLYILRRIAGGIRGTTTNDGGITVQNYDRTALGFFERLDKRGYKMDIDSAEPIIIPADQVKRILHSMMENLFNNYPRRGGK